MAEHLEPRGFCFLENYPHPYGVREKAFRYAQHYNIVVVYVPNGRGYDIFVPARSHQEIRAENEEIKAMAAEERLNDLAMEEFDRKYPRNGVADYGDKGLGSELRETTEDWARSEEDGWYYADD
mgnify:CR=1 FL=1